MDRRQIKDIVNRDLVTLTNCEHEPIHVPGSIQPHGFLLGLTKDDLTITFCSGNSKDFIGLGFEQLLENKFEAIAGKDQQEILIKYINALDRSFSPPLQIQLAGKAFACVVHNNNTEVFVAEFEFASHDKPAIEDVYWQTRQFTVYMQKATTLQTLCKMVADETRRITGYDRVMIYKFDKEYNGEVFAESKIESVEPFLGLHYPHTDIPVQARQLYIVNLLRHIVDINYTLVPIYTTNQAAKNSTLDLSLSTLRSVSPIHIEYLQNMGVGATLAISLIHENRLWGMITCHHYSPKYITSHARIAAQLQGHFLTSQISVRERAEEFETSHEVNKKLEILLKKAFPNETGKIEEIIQQNDLLAFANAHGVIFIINDVIYTNGVVPSEAGIKKLSAWLYDHYRNTGFSVTGLSKYFAPAEDWCGSASGIVYHSIGLGPGNCFILCRNEVLLEVNWAGNPEKAIEKNEHGLSPRKSFALWKEIKNCESAPWLQSELLAASNFAHALQRYVHMLHIRQEEFRQRKLSEKLKVANDELENMNWIGTHDLKEPLRKIQLFASRILDPEKSGDNDDTLNYVSKMNISANRMQTLITDILAYSRLNHLENKLKEVDLDQIVSQVVKDLNFEIHEKNGTVDFSNLPKVTGINFLLQQLFTNLLGNALKFSRQGIPSKITISSEVVFYIPPSNGTPGDFHKINISDNGIGFDEKYREHIFKIFKKLHAAKEYIGTGVGLALCKKIMQNHNGFIDASSNLGEGATFMLYFPVL